MSQKKITICLNMIVKNEEKIILKLLNSVYSIIDFYCICDTGSSDSTKEMIKTFFDKKHIDGILFEHKFKNFGYNRQISYEMAKTLHCDYILFLDADMELLFNKNKPFYKNNLKKDIYFITQKSNNLEYSNIRLVHKNTELKCIGSTHEYYDYPKNKDIFLLDNIKIIHHINGYNRKNKIMRDIVLLQNDIQKFPNRSRNFFYLANTFFDCKQYKEAITIYNIFLNLTKSYNNNCQKWYSFYKIGLCYYCQKKYNEAILSFEKRN